MHSVGYTSKYVCDARTHECQTHLSPPLTKEITVSPPQSLLSLSVLKCKVHPRMGHEGPEGE